MTDIIKSLASTVIFLFAAVNPPQPIGTGFIVAHPFPGKEGAFIPLLVTAKHVVGEQKRILARFTTQAGESTAFVQYDIEELKNNNDYWEHPDEGVDLVVFRSLHFSATKYEAFPIDLIATKNTFEEINIQQTDRVVFPSLLINFMGSSRNYPVFRDGTIALIPNEKVPMKYDVGKKEVVTEQEVILVDATSIQGASGSPIFLWPGPRLSGKSYQIGGTKPYLLGIMHGFYPAIPRETLKVETTKSLTMYAENSGIAIIFPSWRLMEIIELESLKKRVGQIADLEKGESTK